MNCVTAQNRNSAINAFPLAAGCSVCSPNAAALAELIMIRSTLMVYDGEIHSYPREAL